MKILKARVQNNRALPGKPDLVLPKYQTVIFVHGCFWHGHACHLFKMPSTRLDFWQTKIDRNRENDRRVFAALRIAGWRVATIWECALKGRFRMDENTLIDRLAAWLRGGPDQLELTSCQGGET